MNLDNSKSGRNRMKTLDKVMAKIGIPIIIVAAAFFMILSVESSRDISRENNGYVRVIDCVISTPGTVRTKEDIENCYKKVEKELGIKLQRYDTSSYK